MKFARVRTPNAIVPVGIVGDRAFDLSPVLDDITPATLPRLAEATAALSAGTLPPYELQAVDYGAPVGSVGAVIAIGMNYAAHAAESGSAPPDLPVMFLKTPNTIAAPDEEFRIPPQAHKVDWEVELAFVIGQRAYELSESDDPLDYVAGFCVANDLSERTFQLEESGGQWSKGKCVPGSTPLGPWLVTPDEVDHRALRLRSFVNDEPRQDSSTADMVFDVPTIVRHLSQYLALEPGDVVLTGTPEGVALSGRFPYLRPGDVVRIEIDGLGAQRQVMVGGVEPVSGDLDGLVALVTGGGSGIGAAIAAELSRGGAQVAVLDLRTDDVAAPLIGLTCDVSDDASCRAAVQGVVDRFGGLDIVVNNAGIGAQGTVADNPDEEWHRVFDVNVVGMVRVSRAALPHLRASRAGAIVNTCSVAATAGLPQRALYSATKGAVLSLTQAMAADHLREGIRVNCVSPGTADTPWVGRLLDSAADPAAERAALEARQPHGRLVSADEVAGAVAYLASPRSGSTTGVALAVDGGMQALRLRPIG